MRLNFERLKQRLDAIWTVAKGATARMVQRLVSEPGYADALASVVISAVSLTCLRPATIRFIREIAETFAALIRTRLHSRRGFELGWGDLEPGWE